MGQIIVSVREGADGTLRDLELPDDVVIKDLLDDIIQTLNGCDQKQRPGANVTDLFDTRMKKTLFRDGTTESEGVWNGDILELRPKRKAEQQGFELHKRSWV